MTARQANRGGAPVGYLYELAPVEAMAVHFFAALVRGGPHSKSHIWTEFQSALGTDNGRAALKSFENLCTMCSRYGRRPMDAPPAPSALIRSLLKGSDSLDNPNSVFE